MNFRMRPELPGEEAAIREVNLRAFGEDGPGAMVDELRGQGLLEISLVAESAEDGRMIGHIAFSPAKIACAGSGHVEGLALGPLAVVPEWQGRGLGQALVREGLELARARGCRLALLAGSPKYYGRLGFRPASEFGIAWQKGSDPAFQVLELKEDALKPAARGTLCRHPAFE